MRRLGQAGARTDDYSRNPTLFSDTCFREEKSHHFRRHDNFLRQDYEAFKIQYKTVKLIYNVHGINAVMMISSDVKV